MQIDNIQTSLEHAQLTVGHVRSVLGQMVSVALGAPKSPDMQVIEGLAACADSALADLETTLEGETI